MTDGVDDSGKGGDLQFDKAEPTTSGQRTCASCQKGLEAEYYEVGGSVVCPACANAIQGSGKDRGAMLRALAFGAGAALISTIV